MQARVAWELGGDLGLLHVSLTNREVDTVLPDLVDSRSQTKEIMDFFFFWQAKTHFTHFTGILSMNFCLFISSPSIQLA